MSELIDAGIDVDDISDEELALLAEAADPDAPVPVDARPFSEVTGDPAAWSLLPAWYMPPPAGSVRRRRGMRLLVLVTVVAFVALNAYGLCSTYGRITIG